MRFALKRRALEGEYLSHGGAKFQSRDNVGSDILARPRSKSMGTRVGTKKRMFMGPVVLQPLQFSCTMARGIRLFDLQLHVTRNEGSVYVVTRTAGY